MPDASPDFLVPTFRTCERATLECQKGHSCTSTVALLQAYPGLFKPISGLQQVSVKFNQLIINDLKNIAKITYLHRVGYRLQISQNERPKTAK